LNQQSKEEPSKGVTKKDGVIWIKVVYHSHVFHYRIPQAASIAALNPTIPSPLTIKMAMIASLLRLGQVSNAEKLARYLHRITVLISPANAGLTFKAFLRYRSVPEVDKGGQLDESGSLYPSRPHMREYCLWDSNLEVFVEVPTSLKETCKKALANIPYLGAKDSMVSCISLQEVPEPDIQVSKQLSVSEVKSGMIWYLADFKPETTVNLLDLIPTQRKPEHYQIKPTIIPARTKHWGKSTLYYTLPD
jgi:hypothetical protein